MNAAAKRLRTKLKTLLSRRNIVIFAVSLMAVLAVLTFSNIHRLSVYEMKYAVENLGGYSYIVFLLLCCIRSFLLLPCGLFSTLGGLLFGPIKGTVVTLVGFTTGSLINFHLARLLGKEWADRFTKGKIRSIDNLISHNGFVSVLLMRLIPILPFDVVSCVGGLSKIRSRDFVLGTLLGSIPGVFIYTFLGQSVKEFSVKKIVITVVIIVLITMIPILYRLIFKKKMVGRT